MGKLFWFQFFPADWKRDTRCLSPSTRGIWIDILCTLWPLGIRTMPESNWCRELGVTDAEFQTAVQELECFEVALITRKNNRDVTVESRRMARDAKAREYTRLRVSKHRVTHTVTVVKRSCNGTELKLELKEDKDKEETQRQPQPLSSEEIKSLWNGIHGVKPCKQIAGALRVKIDRLRKEHSADWWTALFQEVAQSSFLTGHAKPRDGEKAFRANLDWVTGPINLGKILAGNYTNDNAPTRKERLPL